MYDGLKSPLACCRLRTPLLLKLIIDWHLNVRTHQRQRVKTPLNTNRRSNYLWRRRWAEEGARGGAYSWRRRWRLAFIVSSSHNNGRVREFSAKCCRLQIRSGMLRTKKVQTQLTDGANKKKEKVIVPISAQIPCCLLCCDVSICIFWAVLFN